MLWAVGSLSRIGQWMSAVAHNSALISFCTKILFRHLRIRGRLDRKRYRKAIVEILEWCKRSPLPFE